MPGTAVAVYCGIEQESKEHYNTEKYIKYSTLEYITKKVQDTTVHYIVVQHGTVQ